MAKITPKKNSKLPTAIKSHTDCKLWLQDFYPENSCAYCWMNYEETDVDHYIPKSLAPNLAKEPMNLVLSCIACNRHYKNDYHPKHAIRQKKRNDTSGAYVHDARVTDLKNIYGFSLDKKKVEAIKNVNWANWNIAFFRLNDREKLVDKRFKLLDVLEMYVNFENNKTNMLNGLNSMQRNFVLEAHKKNKEILKKYKLFTFIFELI